MIVYSRLLVLEHLVKKQPGTNIPSNAKDIDLHSQEGCSKSISDGVQTKQTNSTTLYFKTPCQKTQHNLYAIYTTYKGSK